MWQLGWAGGFAPTNNVTARAYPAFLDRLELPFHSEQKGVAAFRARLLHRICTFENAQGPRQKPAGNKRLCRYLASYVILFVLGWLVSTLRLLLFLAPFLLDTALGFVSQAGLAMLGNGVIPDTALRQSDASSHWSKHQPNHSSSELSPPTRLHHHSRHHAHRQQASISKRDDNNALPIFPPPRPSADLAIPRSEGVTPNIIPILSRRPSVLAASAPEDAPSRPLLPASSAAPERKLGKEEDSATDGEKAQATAAYVEPPPTVFFSARLTSLSKKRSLPSVHMLTLLLPTQIRGLQTAVADLNAASTSTARRLDDAYMSVMDKLGTLSNTAAALEELRAAWRDGADGFSRETDELLADVGAQIDGLGTFDSLRRRIESLQSRIHDGRERIQQLSGRVDAVHERIEGWERADREWQERTRRRLKTVWVVTSVLVLVFLVFLLVVAGHDVPLSPQQPHVPDKGGSAASAAPPTSEPPDWVRSAIMSGHVPTPGGVGGGGPDEAGEHGEDSTPGVRLFKSLNKNGRDSRVDAEKQLRMFDEL